MGNYNFSLDLQTDNTMSVIDHWIADESTILEFGPANGRLTRHLTMNRGCSVVIVERDYEAGKEAAQYAVKSYLGSEEGDIDHLEWKNVGIEFDYIIFADVLEHLFEPKKILKEALALLKENGRILISVPNISHNSIILSLLNDRFTYSDTGLLDATHVHFFAYKDLKDMIKDVGLYIADLHQIYSRVGNNEIETTYYDVSGEVGKILRQRENGSTYQFVLNLSKCSDDQCNLEGNIKLLEADTKEEFESLFFYSYEVDGVFTDELTKGSIYKEREVVEVTIEAERGGKIKRLRWNPLPCDGVINILRMEMITDGGQKVPLEIRDCNVEHFWGKLLIFYDAPWIEYRVPNDIEIKQFEIVFQVLAYREKNTGYYEELDSILDAALKTDTVGANEENKFLHFGEYVEKYKKNIIELEENYTKLENDYAKLENDYVKLKAESEEYTEHLANDIKQLQQDMENQREEYVKYVDHLESDIMILRTECEN